MTTLSFINQMLEACLPCDYTSDYTSLARGPVSQQQLPLCLMNVRGQGGVSARV